MISIFMVGILAPFLFICYLSWESFFKRREAFKDAIESQLWISGEVAIESIERSLQEYEAQILSAENFSPLSTLPARRREVEQSFGRSEENIFVLDADFQVVFPQAGRDDAPYIRWDQFPSDSPFSSLFRRAEFLEFTQEKFAPAAELYRQCALSTPIKQLKAYALERYGRCLALTARADEAVAVYRQLIKEYGHYKNRVGLPYGLVAAFAWREVCRRGQVQRDLLETLVDVLDKLRSGEWRVNKSTYDYCSEEIDLILKQELTREKYPELHKSYNGILEGPSAYLKELEFEKLLTENVVPILKEKVVLSQYSNEPLKGRLPLTYDGSYFLISYSRLRDISSGRYFYAGFCWNLDDLRTRRIPEIVDALERASGIQVRLLDEGDQQDRPGEKNGNPGDALSVSFQQFPFPWRFVVTQSALQALKNAGLRENILHGLLVAFITGTIFLAAFLIARDVSRETETIRHKTDFVQNISHELKTPLTLIRLYGEILRDKKTLPEKDQREACEVIIGESDRLSHMINNVLDFSRIERGEKEFRMKTDQLADAVKDTLESYRYHLEKKGFAIREEIGADLQPMRFDREAMASVLINLLSNAMKFSPEKKEISVRLFRRENNAVLQVEDKGTGISKKELNKIFRRFYRSKDEAVSGSRGSGLGLTIVKYIAEAHEGTIEVDSRPGKGSIFSVILPIR